MTVLRHVKRDIHWVVWLRAELSGVGVELDVTGAFVVATAVVVLPVPAAQTHHMLPVTAAPVTAPWYQINIHDQ